MEITRALGQTPLVEVVVRVVVLIAALTSTAVQAREDVQEFPIEPALTSDAAKKKLSGQVAFYFGRQAYLEPAASHGTFRTSKKTSTSGKSPEDACTAAFVAAMVALERRAQQEGGNAVVDIKSNYHNDLTESATGFKCGAGKIMAGVGLQGRVVTLPEAQVTSGTAK